MILDTIIGSESMLVYLPASLAPMTAHLLPRSLCRSNIFCSSAKLHSSLGWLGLMKVIYLYTLFLTFLCIAYHCDLEGRVLLAIYERYDSIWLIHLFRIRFWVEYLLPLSKDVYLPFYFTHNQLLPYKIAQLISQTFISAYSQLQTRWSLLMMISL